MTYKAEGLNDRVKITFTEGSDTYSKSFTIFDLRGIDSFFYNTKYPNEAARILNEVSGNYSITKGGSYVDLNYKKIMGNSDINFLIRLPKEGGFYDSYQPSYQSYYQPSTTLRSRAPASYYPPDERNLGYGESKPIEVCRQLKPGESQPRYQAPPQPTYQPTTLRSAYHPPSSSNSGDKPIEVCRQVKSSGTPSNYRSTYQPTLRAQPKPNTYYARAVEFNPSRYQAPSQPAYQPSYSRYQAPLRSAYQPSSSSNSGDRPIEVCHQSKASGTPSSYRATYQPALRSRPDTSNYYARAAEYNPNQYGGALPSTTYLFSGSRNQQSNSGDQPIEVCHFPTQEERDRQRRQSSYTSSYRPYL